MICPDRLNKRVTRSADGSAGDADYGTIGKSYAHYRQPDDRIAARISQALGPTRTVLNVGAGARPTRPPAPPPPVPTVGAGAASYEPAGPLVPPVEPSASMRAQRPPGRPAAVD